MSTSDLTQAQLLADLSGRGLDATVLAEVQTNLLGSVFVTQDDGFPPFAPDASGHLPTALALDQFSEDGLTIDTSAAGDPALRDLFLSNGITETVTGGANLFIATDDNTDGLNLNNETGNLTIALGAGNNTVILGTGRDVVHGRCLSSARRRRFRRRRSHFRCRSGFRFHCCR